MSAEALVAMAGKGPDRERRRQAILQAARQVFARKGYEPATLEAVAREAGLAKGTLYLYFKNKEDLYFHTAVHVLESLQSYILEQAQRSSGALDRLRAIALGQFDFFIRHRDTLQLLAPFSNPGLARLHKRLIAAMMERWAGHLQRITALVEEGQRAGDLRRDIESRHIALAFLGIANQASQALVRFGPIAKSGVFASGPQEAEPQETPERMADTIMKILVEGVMHR
jgi:TetR/AcrR family fatty acid metabolism transcriptional regulator